jgi:hypothetical protein
MRYFSEKRDKLIESLKSNAITSVAITSDMLEPCLGRHEHERAAVPNGTARHAPESIVSCPCLPVGTAALSGTARQARGADRAVPNRAVPGRPFGKL